MVSSLPQFFWNNTTQRILSQSNNVSYATRGVYRVYDTQDSRKGDYWFRDFGMVMACSYMTELGFRAVEKWYTIPKITEAFGLHALSEQKHPITGEALYSNPRNYSELPNVVRERLMGSLIGKSSSNLVPRLMKELELQQGAKLDETTAGHVKTLLSSPAKDADSIIQQHLADSGLADHAKTIRAISTLENPTKRTDAIKKLLAEHPHLNTDATQKAIHNAVKLEDARQMGILMDHLHRNLNFGEYMRDTYLNQNSKLSGAVSDVLGSFSQRLTDVQQKGKRELPNLLKELKALPPSKRIETFNKKIDPYRNLLYYKDGVQLVQPEKILKFEQLIDQMRASLKLDSKDSLKQPLAELETFYQDLASPETQKHSLNQFWNHSASELKKNISNKIEALVDDVRKLAPEKARHEALDNKFKDLAFDGKHPEFQQSLDALRDKLKAALPNDATLAPNRAGIKAAMQEFTAKLPDDAVKLLKPLVQHASADEFKRMIVDGMKSKAALELISKTQKNGTWPKMAATVILNLIFYGWAASNFDNKILQPYQQKLVAERGTSQEIVTAGYLGLIPGFAVLSQLIDKTSFPMIRRMSHFNRFALVGGAALATFAGSSYAILQQLVKRPPTKAPQAPQTPPAPSTLYRPGMTLSGNAPAGQPPAFAPAASAMSANRPSPFQGLPSTFSNAGFGQPHGPTFPLFSGKPWIESDN